MKYAMLSAKHVGFAGSHIALRDACKCSQCIDQSTKQRQFLFSDIPLDIKGQPEKQANGDWNVIWKNDISGFENHISTYTEAQLQQIMTIPRTEHRLTSILWDNNTFKKESKHVDYDEFINHDVGLAKVLYLFARHGLIFLRNVPKDEKSVSNIAQRIAPLRNTFYGNTWNVRSVPQAINVAYTSKYLGFHMDLLYMRESPKWQFLHCLENSCQGGESRFVDTFKAYDVMMTENQQLATILANTSLRYEYDNDHQYYTDVKPIIAQKKPMELSPRKIKGASNSIIDSISRIYWSPPFMGSIWSDLNETSNSLQQKLEASKLFAQILERPEMVYEEKMEPNTCVIFDNLRILHARNSFDMNSGKRWLRGCYLDEQDALSKEISLIDEIIKLENLS